MPTRAAIDLIEWRTSNIKRFCASNGGEGGIARGLKAARPYASLRDRRRCAGVSLPTLPSFFDYSRTGVPINTSKPNGGEGGIRTLEHLLGCYSLSRRAPSTTRPPLRVRRIPDPRGPARVPEAGRAIKS